MHTRTALSVQQEREIGAQTEARFFEAVDLIRDGTIETPRWLYQIVRASEYEDRACGVDAVAYTERGLIPIQIKSSVRWIPQFRSRHPDFIGIIQIVTPHQPADAIIATCIALLKRHYWSKEYHDYERA